MHAPTQGADLSFGFFTFCVNLVRPSCLARTSLFPAFRLPAPVITFLGLVGLVLVVTVAAESGY